MSDEKKDYRVAIPSYKRCEVIKDKTLSILDRYGIAPEKVTVFVADDEELGMYRDSLKGHKYGENIVKGVPTIGEQRNWIERHYSEGTRLVMLDDDISGVQMKHGCKLVEVGDLETEIIFRGFSCSYTISAKFST